MKLKILPLIALAFLLLSCSGKSPVVKTSFYLNRVEFPFSSNPNNTDKYFSFIIVEYPDSIIYPESSGMAAVEKMRKSLLESLLGQEYVENNYDGNVKKTLSAYDRKCRQTLRHYTVEVYNVGNYRNWSSFIIYEMDEGRFENEKGLCFDLRTGEIAGIDDIFGRNCEKNLCNMVYDKILAEHPQSDMTKEDLEDKIRIGSFIFKNNSVIFLFPVGSVAPESEGLVRVSLGMDEIEEFLN